VLTATAPAIHTQHARKRTQITSERAKSRGAREEEGARWGRVGSAGARKHAPPPLPLAPLLSLSPPALSRSCHAQL
jgi:hypothetical protein